MPQEQSNARRNRQVIGILTVIACLLVIGVWVESARSPGTSGGTRCGDRFSAMAAAEALVRQQLKAPSTAKFPGLFDEEPRVTSIGQCQYRVASYVDAQNSFGAMLRMNYRIDMAYSLSTQKWTMIDFQMQ